MKIEAYRRQFVSDKGDGSLGYDRMDLYLSIMGCSVIVEEVTDNVRRLYPAVPDYLTHYLHIIGWSGPYYITSLTASKIIECLS